MKRGTIAHRQCDCMYTCMHHRRDSLSLSRYSTHPPQRVQRGRYAQTHQTRVVERGCGKGRVVDTTEEWEAGRRNDGRQHHRHRGPRSDDRRRLRRRRRPIAVVVDDDARRGGGGGRRIHDCCSWPFQLRISRGEWRGRSMGS